MKRLTRELLCILIIFSLVCTLIGAKDIKTIAGEKNADVPIVAVLNAPNGTSQNCLNSTISVLKSYGIEAKPVTPDEIRSGGLANFDVIIAPGGGGTAQARDLGQQGCEAVARFVYSGGGYIGICAGAYLAAKGYNDATSMLELVDANVYDVGNWARGTGDIQVSIQNPNHPVMNGYYRTITAHYFNGPVLKRANDPNMPDYDELAVFTSDIYENGPKGITPNATAALAATYGEGRVVLFSFHPEFTGGLERMLVQAVLWVAKVEAANFPVIKRARPLTKQAVWMWASTVYSLGVNGAKTVTDQLKQHGFTDIYLLTKGTTGKVYYRSRVALSMAYNDRDVLQEVIDEAHRKGIKVHAWLTVNSDTTFAAAYPDERMVHIIKGPDTSGRISPLSPVYRTYMCNLVSEIVENYQVDGIHLDYIRYPAMTLGFNQNYEMAVAQQAGIDMQKVRDIVYATQYTQNPQITVFEAFDRNDPDVVGWVNVRKNAIRSFAEEMKNIIKSHSSTLEFSAALMPEAAHDCTSLVGGSYSRTFGVVHYGQDHSDAAQIYDVVMPMLYWKDFGRSPQWVTHLTMNEKETYGARDVYAGLQAFDPAITSELNEAVTFLRQSGYRKIILFRYGTFSFAKVEKQNISPNRAVLHITISEAMGNDIAKAEINLLGSYIVKNVILKDKIPLTVNVSPDKKKVTISGNPCISKWNTLKVSIVAEGSKGNDAFEPANVLLYKSGGQEVLVYNQYNEY